jgi:negative elongation factor B
MAAAGVPKFIGTGLEEVNVPGQAFLREALTSCTDPLKAIETFQVAELVILDFIFFLK